MKHGKKLFCFLLAVSCMSATLCAAPISVKLGGETLVLKEAPQIMGGSVYLPLRTFAKTLGYSVSYNEVEKNVTLKDKALQSFTLALGTDANGQTALLKEGLTYIPVRLVSENFGYAVDWSGESQTVSLTPLKSYETLIDETMAAIISGDYAKVLTYCDETVRSQLPLETLTLSLENLKGQLGPILSYEVDFKSPVGDYMQIDLKVTYEKSPILYTFMFDKAHLIAGINTNLYPEEVPLPKGAVEKEMTVKTGDYQLPATLTLPSATGNFPVVVLVHGSGPNDRDETIYNTKVFRDLAYGLAEKGIATLRYDKRTFTYAAQIAADPYNLTLEDEVIDDALSAIKLMEETEHINANKIYVLGHSLGGMLVPMIESQTDDVAGYIMATAPARNLADLVIDQYDYLLGIEPSLSEAEKTSTLEEVTHYAELAKTLKLGEEAPEIGFLGSNNNFWAALNAYDQVAMAKEMTVPVFLLQGERDYQVTMKDFNIWQEALSGKSNFTLKSYKDLSHLLVSGEGMSTPDEYLFNGQVSHQVIEDIASWIK